jgi:hypothetical protein
MPHGSVIDDIPAPGAEVFALLHDYDRRLEWDTLLSAAYLTDGATHAGLGVRSVCQGKSRLGRIALLTEYVSFRPPELAAVRMVNRPAFFDAFAATIRHTDKGDGSSTIEYIYTFIARPRWLRPFLHPIMGRMFKRETAKRIAALRLHFSNPVTCS